MWPSCVNFTALPKRLSTTWRRRTGSARTMTGTSGFDGDDELNALGRGLQRGGGHGLVQQVNQVELDVLELQPIGLDLGQVQHAVDQARAAPWRCRG